MLENGTNNFDDSLMQSVKDSKKVILVVQNCIRYFEGTHVILKSNEDRHIIPGAKYSDMRSGQDLLCFDMNDGSQICGVASRIQRTQKCYRTFTIREYRESGAETEYSKRRNELDKNRIGPKYTYQAYIDPDNNQLTGLAMVRTIDLFDAVDNGLFYRQHTGWSQKGQAGFLVIEWDELIRNKYPIVEYVNGCTICHNEVIKGATA